MEGKEDQSGYREITPEQEVMPVEAAHAFKRLLKDNYKGNEGHSRANDLAIVEMDFQQNERAWEQREEEMVVADKERMRKSGKEGVLSPRVERKMEDIAKKLEDKTGAGALVFGPPGTGKTFFVEMLSEKIRKPGQRIVSINSAPFQTSESLIATQLVTERVVPAQAVLSQLEEFETRHETQERNDLSWRLLDNLVSEETKGLKDKGEKETVTQEFLANLGLQNIMLDQDSHIVTSGDIDGDHMFSQMKNYYQDLAMKQKLEGWNTAEKGPMYDALQKGWITNISEPDKVEEIVGGFGVGLEDVLDPPNGGGTRTSAGGKEVVVFLALLNS